MQTQRPLAATTDDIISTVAALEQQRCRASIAEDFAALSDLLDDDLTFVHSTGYAHDKAQYLAFLAERVKSLDIERPALTYRVLTDTVVCTGPLVQTMQRKTDGSRVDIRALVTQIWVRRASGWKLLHHHSTRTPD
ncbi:hypothetical protein PCA31118_05142 [Pandoraea captiosa]|uniref:DUF4440 domain-containing protein n=1 Tax=Pandoraea captiosa TaxID=2508302 RepID=A0A5E5AT11_9BURK|nr:nuclear transport factor 2 family protein [Pandoraea captiosa]VVE76137.1 hypothetical protein PCA31118_05142 [Pandoraea captiosa]